MVSSFSQRLDSPSAFSSYRDDVRQGKVSDSGGLIGNLPAPIDAVVPGTQYLSLDPHDSRSGYRVVRALDANGLPTARIEAFGPSGWDWFYAEHPNWTGDVTGQPYKVQGPFPGANPVSPLSNMAPTPRPGIAAALPAPDLSRFSSAGQLDPVIRTTVTAEPTVTLPQRLGTPRPPAAITPPNRLPAEPQDPLVARISSTLGLHPAPTDPIPVSQLTNHASSSAGARTAGGEMQGPGSFHGVPRFIPWQPDPTLTPDNSRLE
jgi:hypothetical protein